VVRIADEDVARIQCKVYKAVATLANGMRKVEQDVDPGDGLGVIEVVGYWVNNIMRIDIKLRSE